MVTNLHKTIIFWGSEAEILDLVTSKLYIFAIKFLKLYKPSFWYKIKKKLIENMKYSKNPKIFFVFLFLSLLHFIPIKWFKINLFFPKQALA